MSSPASSQPPGADPLEHLYIQGEQLLAARRIKEAADLCQRLLEHNPNYGRGYFLLSRIYYHTGNLDKAMEFVDHAIRLMPKKDGMMHYMRGSYFLSKGDFDAAGNDMKLATQLEPMFGYGHLMLATVYIHKQKYADARKCLAEATKLGLAADALHQEGVMLTAENRKEEAVEAFSKALKANDQHALSYVRRGELALSLEWNEVAEEDAQKAVQLNPQSYEAWRLNAMIASHQKQHQKAIDALQHAIRLRPNLIELWRLLGTELQFSGKPQESIEAYLQALNRDPEDAYSLNALPTLMMAMGRTMEAELYLEKAIANFPDNPVLKHFKAFFDKSSGLDRASDEYVQNVFDNYAEMFDIHLQQGLRYDIPALMEKTLRSVLQLSPEATAALSYLDLGCGTGLGAKALENLTQHRVGVDLSPKMLDKARDRKLYDELVVSDIVPYLDSASEAFDLVTALDVFVYIGNLDPIFDSARKVMKSGSRFAFSVEGDDFAENGYVMRSSGRFAHSGKYLQELANTYGYTVELMEPAVIRYEANKPLDGYIAIFLRD